MLENKKGHIIEVASLASYAVVPGIVDYGATKVGVLALYEGLNQELKHRYPNGRCIQTTIVHPTWVGTPLVKDYTATIKSTGAAILSASLVSDSIVKQVLSGQSGHVFVPPRASFLKNLRSWPSWLQEFTRDRTGRKM